MKENRNEGYKLILHLTILILLLGSCKNHNKSNQIIQETGTSSEAVSTVNDTANFLKYTTGIRSILEDSKGNIWFGSDQEGVCLFDGEKLTYFTVEDGLSHNQIRSIYEGSDGSVWFEGGKGLSSYDGKKITTHTERNYKSKDDWKLGKNDLWFKGDETIGHNEPEGHPGVYRYNGNELRYHVFPVTPKEDENAYYSVSTPFVKGKNGMHWFGTYGAAIGYDGKSFTIFDDKRLGLNDETGHLHIRSIFEDSKGNLWIGNNGIGVFMYNGDKVINFSKLHKLGGKDSNGNSLDRVFSIAEDEDGNMWFGVYKSGAWFFDGLSLRNYTKKDGIPFENIYIIYKTKKGELLFGGDNPSGVYRFNGSSFDRIY